jgi:hypothetical protein
MLIFKRWIPELLRQDVNCKIALRIVDAETGEAQFQDPTMKKVISQLHAEQLDAIAPDRREGWRTYRLLRVDRVIEEASKLGLRVAERLPLTNGDRRRGVITYDSGKGLPTACVVFRA